MIIAYTATGSGPKGIAEVSGILEGSDFNIKSIYETLRKGPKRKD